MSKPFPKTFEDILLPYLKESFLPKALAKNPWNEKDAQYFSKGILRLNQLFTDERGQRPQHYFNDPVLRSGYLAYFLPINLMKAYQLFQNHVAFNKEKITIADFGCGPLTLTMAYILQNPGKEYEVYAYEQNSKILNDGIQILERICEKQGTKIKILSFTKDLRQIRYRKNEIDLLLFGNVFNEFHSRDQQWALCENLIESFSHKNSKIFFIEPSAKKPSRDLQALRDKVIERFEFQVSAPCLHQSTCPLNQESKSDWCHFKTEWESPGFIRELDRKTRLKKTLLQYSYLIFEQGVKTHKDNEFIAISDPMPVTGSPLKQILGCGPLGRKRFKGNIVRGLKRGDFFRE